MADEQVRAQLAQLVVLPANQCLGGDDAAAAQIHLWLVHEAELIVVDRTPQLGFYLQPVLLAPRQLRGE